ncbi:signal transduction histidine kinase [Branchiibius hedensis]|uniref:Signal transduction histidine kinase n=2 Tax=Branchiibius hedensis TaxID=672460 RepID=A0A2Y8ZR55_9MICO|nr:signal transduction histidine kinase [Branchiibius hedensis]SSA34354.1 Signal transduction histidine kinase [Branchiibius hedensis]
MEVMTSQTESVQGPYWDRVEGPVTAVRWAPLVLLSGSLLCSIVVPVASGRLGYLLLIVLSVASALLAGWWMRRRELSTSSRVAICAAHLSMTAAMIAISPVYGIFGFFGYIIAMLLFDGPALIVALGLNALIMAGSQVGGFGQAVSDWRAFLALSLVNAGVVAVIVHFGMKRAREVQQREAAADALAEVSRRNQELQDQLLERAHEQGILQERERLSREIHDTVAQDLVAIVSQLEAIDSEGDWRPRVDAAKSLARDGLGEARRAVSALRSPLLDDASAAQAVRALVDDWSSRHHIRARLTVHGTPARTEQDQVILRVCQEALSNVARHSGASCVEVELQYTQDGLLLQVRDDGRGFDPLLAQAGHGLRNMRERVEAVGGSLDVESNSGAGCLIGVAAPA